MSSIVLKINFSKKEHLSEKIYKSIKKSVADFLRDNPDIFVQNQDKIFMNFDVKIDNF